MATTMTENANNYLHRMATMYWEEKCRSYTNTQETDIDPEEAQRQLELYAVALKLNGWQTIWWDEDIHEFVMDAYPEEVEDLLRVARS